MKPRKKAALKAFKAARTQRELDRLIRKFPDIAVLDDIEQKLFEIRAKIIQENE